MSKVFVLNINPQLNVSSLDHNSQIQCTAESNPQGSGSVRKSYCEIPLPTHLGNNQSIENCKTVGNSPESSPKVTTDVPDPLVSITDLLPESPINLQANVDPVIPVSDANLPPRVTEAPSDATILKRNPSLSKNETPCPFILRRGWCLKGMLVLECYYLSVGFN